VTLFTYRELERLAGPAALARGRGLVDAVEDLYEDEHSLCATVHDGQPFLAMVHHERPLSGECDCPNGAPPGLCEHSVAVGLAYLSDYEGL